MRLQFSALLTALIAAPLLGVWASTPALYGSGDRGRVPKGFVTTKGTKFRLDNNDFVSIGWYLSVFLLNLV